MISLTDTNTGTTRSFDLGDIEKLALKFSDQHAALSAIVAELEAAKQKLMRQHLPALRAAVARAAAAKLTLHTAIAAAPGLFESPRTRIFSGIKVGFQKGKGGIEFEDADKVCALIRKTFGDDAIAYLRTTEAPDKKMLADLPVSELKKIGCTVADTGDVVVIKPTDSEIEKTVAALLKDAVESEVQS